MRVHYDFGTKTMNWLWLRSPFKEATILFGKKLLSFILDKERLHFIAVMFIRRHHVAASIEWNTLAYFYVQMRIIWMNNTIRLEILVSCSCMKDRWNEQCGFSNYGRSSCKKTETISTEDMAIMKKIWKMVNLAESQIPLKETIDFNPLINIIWNVFKVEML